MQKNNIDEIHCLTNESRKRDPLLKITWKPQIAQNDSATLESGTHCSKSTERKPIRANRTDLRG